jgi:hypothetical protein
MKNPETGKFCRGCGTDLATVSDALTGKLSNSNNQNSWMIQPIQPIQSIGVRSGNEKSVTWESMISTSFVGLAFLIISIILGVSGRMNASRWWFWLLIPAFAMLGTGLAQYIQLKKNEQKTIPQTQPETVKNFSQTPNQSLPPIQTEYIAPDSRYKTGDLVPPSVAEGTTRHLEINSEGETMTLPKK